MKIFAVSRSDGMVSILRVQGDEDTAPLVERTYAGAPFTVLSYREVTEADVPEDRTFRNAVVDDGSTINIDMPKARAIHMSRIRVARDVELRRLDIEQLRGNDVTAEKQRLRDIPQTFDLTVATTPEELKALWPADLPK